jgi:serine protease Do
MDNRSSEMPALAPVLPNVRQQTAGWLFIGLVALVVLMALPGVARATGPQSVADLAERLSPAVVNISTRQEVKQRQGGQSPIPNLPEGSPFQEFFEEFFNRRGQEGQPRPRRNVNSLGSGFVVDPAGIVITNNHVIEGADEIEVNFADGSKLQAEIVGRDAKTDLAVLKVSPQEPLPAVSFGDSDKMRVGDWVMAIGNPFGLGGSVTLGIVSARNRNINSGPYDDFLQTDAAINRGNSGGPLFNMDGEVIGINTAIISPSGGSIGIGFSVPSSTALGVIDQLREFGETRRGWLGVKIQTVGEDMVESLGLDRARGALVADVTPTGPAQRAGIKAGDVIIEFDGQQVEEMRDLPRIVAETAVGKQVVVELMRKGKKIEVSVKLGRLEESEKIAAAAESKAVPGGDAKVLGMELSAISDELRSRHSIPDTIEGVVVTAVSPDSPAADKRIQVGDVIAEAGEKKVSSPGDVAAQVKALEEEGRNSILMLVLKASRKFDPHFIALRLKKD